MKALKLSPKSQKALDKYTLQSLREAKSFGEPTFVQGFFGVDLVQLDAGILDGHSFVYAYTTDYKAKTFKYFEKLPRSGGFVPAK